MRQLNSKKMRLVVAGVAFAIFICVGKTRADFVFGWAENLGPMVNTDGHNNLPCISADGLELYFGVEEKLTDGYGLGDIWVSTRETTEDAWGIPENLGPLVNSSRSDNGPTISSDGLELYFMSWRDGGMGSIDLWVTKRASKNDPWGQALNVGAPVNSADRESYPSLSADALELYFTLGNYNAEAGAIFCVSKRETRDAPWGEPVSLGPMVNSWPHQVDPSISSDGLALVFCDWWQQDSRPGGLGGVDLWLSLRATTDSEWGPPVNLGSCINTMGFEGYGMISADGSTLYFTSSHYGGFGGADLWQAPILPVVDFDDDGSVDMSDLLTMISAWGTDERLCDIGPMPWGDGVVDEADLEVLMEHWGEFYPIIVDNFESYTGDSAAAATVFHTWIDGLGYLDPAPGYSGNGTGSVIGNWPPPIAEQTIVHGGYQSLPFYYDNDGTVWEGSDFETSGLAYYAETQREWEDPQDWTRKGVGVLSLWFYGEPDNSAEPFYVGLEDSSGNRKDVTHPDPVALTVNDWLQWSIPLADFTDVDLTAIKVMYIGVGDPAGNQPGGSGLVRIDDIELHVPATP